MAAELSQIPVIFLAFANELTEKGFLRGLTREMKYIMRALEPAVQEGRCHLKILPAATQEEITEVFQDAFYQDRIWIFHYGGHADEDELWLEGTDGGNAAFFSVGLARFLGAQKNLRLVFLNACATREHATLLHAANVPAVIATSRKIEDTQATEFAQVFYQGLGGGASLQEAYQEAEGVILGTLGDTPFSIASGNTRSLFWDENWEGGPLPDLDLPWRMSLRQDESWIASAWRLFYALEPTVEEGTEQEASSFVGQKIGNYEIVELLGEGSLGAVFKARHSSLNEDYAIKITHRAKMGFEYLKQIIISGNKGLATIKHPNVARFYDVGVVPHFGHKRLYMVMELVKGQRMDQMQILHAHSLNEDIERLREYALRIASGIQAAHNTRYTDGSGVAREGIVHGHLKARKVLFTPEGVPKIIDFMFADVGRSPNIQLDIPESVRAKQRAEDPESYLPPEVIRGESPLNAQSDIFAWGAMFFEVVTSKSIAKMSFNDVDDLHKFVKGQHRLFPKFLSKVLFKSTKPRPTERYQKMEELIQDLINDLPFHKRILYWFRRK